MSKEGSEEKIQTWLAIFKKNWRQILLYVLIGINALSIIMGWGGYSYVFAIKSGGTKAQISLEDRCLDSLDQVDLNDYSTFVPKKPKYFVVHCTASKNDQTEADLCSYAGRRGAVFRETSIGNWSPLDGWGQAPR